MQPLNNVQKLEIVPLREAFPHEALDFTKWLETNIDALSSRIGIELTVLEREKAVGSFNVDLFCETSGGRYAIVENQLERSDHGHLGQLLTYLVNLEAKTAIWVTPDARPEHERVIDWLNESTSEDYAFYLVQVEAIRIGNSPFAPLFTVQAAPDEQIREIGETKKELADQEYQRKEFWTQLLARSKIKLPIFSNAAPTNPYLVTGAGRSGFSLGFGIYQDRGMVNIYFDVGDSERNKSYFDILFAQREAIEQAIGDTLEWQRLDNKRACRIMKTFSEYGGLNSSAQWQELQDKMIDAMFAFDRVFRPLIRKL